MYLSTRIPNIHDFGIFLYEKEGKKANITISTVALGQDADRNLLESISEYGSGRFYDVTDSSVIPSILSRETVMATRTYIEDHPFYPKIQPYPEWVKLFGNGVPKMNAYIAVTPKSTAQVSILSKKNDPVLAEWQYGLGRTAAFTSDTTGKWAGDWARWDGWSNFWSHLVTKTFPSYKNQPYEVSVNRKNSETQITLSSDKVDLLPLEAAVVSQSGKEMKVQTKMTAPGMYELSMSDAPGMYFLRLQQKTENGGQKFFQTGFSVPFSEEYLLKGINKPFLKEITGLTNGGKLEKEKDAFAPIHKSSYQKQAFSGTLLLIAFLLFFIEIAIRRFGIQKIASLLPKKRNNLNKDTENTTHVKRLIQTKDRSSKPSMGILKDEPSISAKMGKNTNKANSKQIQHPSNEDRLQRLMDAKKRRKR